MSREVQEIIKGTFKISLYGYDKDDYTRVLIVCHDFLPIRYKHLEIKEEWNDSIKCVSILPPLSYDSYINNYISKHEGDEEMKFELTSAIIKGCVLFEYPKNLFSPDCFYTITACDARSSDHFIISQVIYGEILKSGVVFHTYCHYKERVVIEFSFLRFLPGTFCGLVWFLIKVMIIIKLLQKLLSVIL